MRFAGKSLQMIQVLLVMFIQAVLLFGWQLNYTVHVPISCSMNETRDGGHFNLSS